MEMKASQLLVVTLHSSTARPPELKNEWLSGHQSSLLEGDAAETDRFTSELYDWRAILGNQQIEFPYSQVYINASRHPQDLAEVVPLQIRDQSIYRPGFEPSRPLRQALIKNYYLPFYEAVKQTSKSLILNGHSTVVGHASLGTQVLKWDIVLSDSLEYRGQLIRFAPAGYIDYYAAEINQRLPHLRIGKNSVYLSVYDHLCVTLGWDGLSTQNHRVPVIHQETDESLYITDGQLDRSKLQSLRQVFAMSILATMRHFASK